MGEFRGFGPKALPFFTALKFHQSKEWFEENRALYESDVLQPMVALVEDLTAAFARKRVPLKADGKRSIFRLNRDIRFSKDKSPYKTQRGDDPLRGQERSWRPLRPRLAGRVLRRGWFLYA